MAKNRLRVGLALSGGTAKSVLHVGVLKALVEADIPIDYISGTSGGSIVATGFAAGIPIEKMERFATTLSWWKLAKIKLSKLGFVSSKPIEQFMDTLLPKSDFEDLTIPCAVPVTDLVTGNKVVFSSGPIAPIVRASCSIPQIYQPVEIEGAHYVDGGLSEYLPVESVREFGEQFTIAINLGMRGDEYEKPTSILGLIMQITNMIARQNINRSVRRADFIIHPDIDAYSSFDFSKAEELIELGYFYTRQRITELRHCMAQHNRPWRRVRGWLSHQK